MGGTIMPLRCLWQGKLCLILPTYLIFLKCFERVISVFLICRIGNDAWWHEGVSPNAKKYYDSLFELFDEDAVIIMLKYVKEHRALLRGKYRPKNFKEICSLMKSPLLSDRCNDILDYIISFTGSLDNVFEIKQFKELSVGKLD